MFAKYFFWFSLIVIVFVRFITSQPHFVNGQLLKISGVLYSEPNTGGQNIKFNLSGLKVTAKKDDVHYGDTVVVEGIYKEGSVSGEVKEIKTSTNIFTTIRKKIISFYETSLPRTSASLVGGITIGAKSNLPRTLSNNLRATGTSHIVVASGMNISMVGEFVLTILLLVFKRRRALLFTIILIWSYTLIAGFEAPIVRASIMASIAFGGQILGKISNTLRYVILTGLIMLMIVPMWLTDVGFILSFATTISLVLFEAKVSNLLKFLPAIIKEDLCTSIAAQIGSAPVILFFFGNFNPLSPVINTLVLWIVAPVMIVGAVSGLVSFFSPELGRLILLTVYPLTIWFISVVNFFG